MATSKKGDPELKIWSLADGKLAQIVNAEEILGKEFGFSYWPWTRFSPDGKQAVLMAQGNTDKQTVSLLWDLEQKKLIHKLNVDIPLGSRTDVAWIDSERFVHTTDKQGILIFDRDGNQIRQWKDEANHYGRVTLSADQTRLACLQSPSQINWTHQAAFIQIRDMQDGRILSTHCVLPSQFDSDLPLSFGPTGHWHSPKEKEMRAALCYIAVTDNGKRLMLTPDEFEKQYGWKNDPGKILPE